MKKFKLQNLNGHSNVLIMVMLVLLNWIGWAEEVKENNTELIMNFDFKNWRKATNGENLPVDWKPLDYKYKTNTITKGISKNGNICCFLNGQIESTKNLMLNSLQKKNENLLMLSVDAKGAKGHLKISIWCETYRERRGQLFTPLEVDTSNEWKNYKNTIFLAPWPVWENAYLLIEADGVLIDNVKIKTVSDSSKIEAFPCPDALMPKPVQLEYYPIQKKINLIARNISSAEKKLLYSSADIALFKDNKLLWEKHISRPVWAESDAHFTIDLKSIPFELEKGAKYLAKGIIYNDQGVVSYLTTLEFEEKELPWLNNKLGLAPIIIPPFKPITVKGTNLSCVGRNYFLGNDGLPKQIMSNGKEVLSDEIKWEAVAKDGKINISPFAGLHFFQKEKNIVKFQGISKTNNMDLILNGELEQDGMIKYRLRLLPSGTCRLKKLSLKIPLSPTKYLHCVRNHRPRANTEYIRIPQSQGSVWGSAKNKDKKGIFTNQTADDIWGTFVPYIWIGDENRGFCWFADNDKGWINDADKPCLELKKEENQLVLYVNFITIDAKITSPREIVFGIQATPVKPTPVGVNQKFVIEDVGMRNSMIGKCRHGLISEDLYLNKNILKAREKAGTCTYIYLANDLVGLGDPINRYLYYEWAHRKHHRNGKCFDSKTKWNHRMFGTDPLNYEAFRGCAKSSRVDYDIYCLSKLLGKGKFNGVYLDNSYPLACKNIQHENCCYLRENGILQGGYNIFQTRELVKRAAVLAYQKGCKWPRILVHMTEAMVIPCFSFADLCIDGEEGLQWYDRTLKKDFIDLWPLERIAIMGAVSWGPMRGWLPLVCNAPGCWKRVQEYAKICRKQDAPTRAMLAMTKLFDMWIWKTYSFINYNMAKSIDNIEARCAIGSNDTEFYGYWENKKYIQPQDKDIYSSFYVRPNKLALVYVSNLSPENKQVSLKLDFSRWNLNTIKVIDAESGREIKKTKGFYNLEIPRHDFRVLKITNEQ